MPSETRFLTFETNELYQALYEFSRRTGRIKVPAEISDLSFSRTQPPKMTVRFRDVGASPNLEAEEIAAVLIFYCLDTRVPLPRSARKAVQFRDNKIELVVYIGTSGAETATGNSNKKRFSAR